MSGLLKMDLQPLARRKVSGPGLCRMLLTLAAFSAVAACARPPELVGVDNPQTPVLLTPEGKERTIYIATTRQASEVVGALYGDERAPELGFASVEVHIPPNHVPGELERPEDLPPDPATEFAIVAPTIYQGEQPFIAALNAELARLPVGKRDILVFIHGYNTTTSDAILRLGQFVEDTNYQGVPVLFTWASGGSLAKYVYDINSALTARPKIGQLAEVLGRTQASGYDVFAHSMGSLLLMEGIVNANLAGTFDRMGRMRTIVLASPDIDIDLFESQLSQIGAPMDNLYVLVSKDDEALRISRLLSGGVDRLGAADAERVAGFGVTVLDLSEIDDSASGSHSKFAGSPEVVQLLGQGLNASRSGMAGRATLAEMLVGVPLRIVGN